MSTPSLLFGRSRTWPLEARTSKFGPRYLPMVRAFAGDSTMTRLRPFLPERLGSIGSSSSSSISSSDFAALRGAFVLALAFAGAFARARALPLVAGSIFSIAGSVGAAFDALVGFFGVTSVRRVTRAGIERDPVLVVEPVDEDLGRELLRFGLGVDGGPLLAGAGHDLLELLRSDAPGLVEAEEVGVGRRGEQRPLGARGDPDVLPLDARLARIVLAGVRLQRAEDHLERLVHDVRVVPPGVQHLGQLQQRVLVPVHVRLQL